MAADISPIENSMPKYMMTMTTDAIASPPQPASPMPKFQPEKSPEVEALAREVQGKAEVVQIDVDEQRDLAAQYKISSIPCFVVVKNGQEVSRQTGAIPKSEMRRMLGL